MESLNLTSKYLKIAAVVGVYWIFSTPLTFINILLYDTGSELQTYFLIPWLKYVVTTLLCVMLSLGCRLFPGKIKCLSLKVDPELMKATLPLSIISVCISIFSTLWIRHMDLPTYLLRKSLILVFTVIFSYLSLQQTTSKNALACCIFIIVGFCLSPEKLTHADSFSILGLVFGVLTNVSIALYTVFIKKTLLLVDNSVWSLIVYSSINACFLFLPLTILAGDIQTVWNFRGRTSTTTSLSMSSMIIIGIAAFVNRCLTALQIQVTSPLTHVISSKASACLPIMFAGFSHREVQTHLWWIGNVLVLLGAAGYAEVKRRELQKQDEETIEAALNTAVSQPKSSNFARIIPGEAVRIHH